MKLMYIPKRFGAPSLQVIQQCNDIISTYAAQGFDLTLRQLYYQMVSRALIANKQSEYKRLGGIINDARLAGLVDWDRIVDRTRSVRTLSHWNTPADIIESAAYGFKVDYWTDQPVRLEVWIEKDALAGVFEPTCQDLDIPLFSCRGYTSQSEVWSAAQRLERHMRAGQKVVILHFGDHDPSGLDMTRDIRERLELFTKHDWARWIGRQMRNAGEDPADRGAAMRWAAANAPWDTMLEIHRIALNFDQVQAYNPPPNPAKETDARFAGYMAEHGDESWELDALEPSVLDGLVRDTVEDFIDRDKFEARKAEEQKGKDSLRTVANRWEEVEEQFGESAS